MMENNFNIGKEGYFVLNEDNDILIENGLVKCFTKDGDSFQINYEDINFSNEKLFCDLNGTNIVITLPKKMINNNNNLEEINKENTHFCWDNKNTKLFLDLYKSKKELISTRQIKTLKHLWKLISKEMNYHGYQLSPLQVENKYKSLERSYKKMIQHNKKTGNCRTSCPFENELHDILGKKHKIVPLAVMGSKGLILKEPRVEIVEEREEVENPDDPLSLLEDNDTSPSTTTSTCTKSYPSSSSANKRLKTADYLNKCYSSITNYTKEIKEEKQNIKDLQIKMLEKQEELIDLTKNQWEASNKLRKERNEILKDFFSN
ncbi:putative leucine-rich repeat-containing protein DDB_G0290503 [Prorops nasuta]|uniref:putative leucine-rich repeat-containing protein DDB_G0290503 n=1 Tax=Prorops nasuta TaxID=863751 RepID=UPI0034CE91C9